jgi:DNA repair photolyase
MGSLRHPLPSPARLTERALPLIDGVAAVVRRNGQAPIRLFEERPREILTRHDFGAAGVHFTLNPYRGCSMACVYCSARPLHEYLGEGGRPFSAGADFESKLVARPDAPALLEAALMRGHGKRLRGRVVQLSGATDPYQPLEAALKITRGCLEVLLHHANPVAIQTKSELVLRDRDLLLALHRAAGVHVAISLSSFDEARSAALEPGAPSPAARIRLIEKLAEAGIPVGVSIAPAILGLSDTDIVRILTAAKDAGATSAFYLRLKLPGLIEPALVRRVRASVPERARKVLAGLDGFGAAAPGRRAHADDPMEQIFSFTAERLGLAHLRGAPWPSSASDLEARGAHIAEAEAKEAPAPADAELELPLSGVHRPPSDDAHAEERPASAAQQLALF